MVISIKWVNEMVQNHAYSQAKLSEVILEVLRRLMGSSLFQDRAPRGSDFLVNAIISSLRSTYSVDMDPSSFLNTRTPSY